METRSHPPADPIAVIGGRLIDGCGGHIDGKVTVLVEDGRIKAVGPQERIAVPASATVIEAPSATVMPGLIDAHVHVGNIAVFSDQTLKLPPAVYVHLASRNLENDLDMGFTTLRDAGGLDWGFRDAVERGLVRGPRLLLSVSPLSPTGGHFDKRGVSLDAPQPRNSIGVFPEICDGPDEVRKAARQVLRKGADQIKVAADGGVISPTDRPGRWQFSVKEMRAAVEVAEAAGTYVMAHAYSPVAIRHCVEAGVRSIEHGNLVDGPTADLMASRGTFYVPTLAVYDVLSGEGRHELDDLAVEKLEMVHRAGMRALQLARQAGVKIGAGSDIIGPYQHLKGREFALKGAVMTPMEVIVAATRTNAELIGLADRLGTLEPGKIADVILVNGNPLEDLTIFERAAREVVFVMKAGTVMKNLL
jgi:imidazolonepropionase-like amidohydrolase